MQKRFLLNIIFTILIVSCGKTDKNKSTSISTDTIASKTKQKPTTDVSDFKIQTLDQSNRVYVKPSGKNDDGTVYLSADSNSVSFIFGLNRCGQSFPAIDSNNSIMLKWNMSDKLVCTYKNYFNQTFGLKSYPKNGDIFAHLTAQGDSIIRINYVYKDFIDAQNIKGRDNKEFRLDTLFPVIFKCSNCDSK